MCLSRMIILVKVKFIRFNYKDKDQISNIDLDVEICQNEFKLSKRGGLFTTV